jgi:hypothetical protein
MVPRSLADMYQRFREHATFISPEDGSNMFLQNVSKYLLDHLVSHPRTHKSSCSPTWGPQMSQEHNKSVIHLISNNEAGFQKLLLDIYLK